MTVPSRNSIYGQTTEPNWLLILHALPMVHSMGPRNLDITYPATSIDINKFPLDIEFHYCAFPKLVDSAYVLINVYRFNTLFISRKIPAVNTASYYFPIHPSFIVDLKKSELLAGDIVKLKFFASDTGLYPQRLFKPGGDSTFNILVTGPVSVNEKDNVIQGYSLFQNYPNPFNPSTVIDWSTGSAGLVQLRVYDVLGNEVKTLVNEYRHSGHYSTLCNAEGLNSGVYFYRLTSGWFS